MVFNTPVSLRFAGIGGQGNILMGIILAKSLIKEGKWVIQSQSYTAQVRGGPSHCDVLYSNEWIDYPKAENFDVLFALHPSAIPHHYMLLKKNGVFFIDTSTMNVETFNCVEPENIPSGFPIEICRITKKILGYSFTKAALENFKASVVANMIGLGALIKVTGVVNLDTLKETISETVRKKYVDMNLKAVDFGYGIFQKEYKLEQRKKKHPIGFE
ncbi:MAG: 2-oxoacid:acceptor oxidoreductase family protein [Thermotogaceae bacterium]|nr:2-oxoacid:acceptor oxidoreductase family protein [Thermotogaceae bacterium]